MTSVPPAVTSLGACHKQGAPASQDLERLPSGPMGGKPLLGWPEGAGDTRARSACGPDPPEAVWAEAAAWCLEGGRCQHGLSSSSLLNARLLHRSSQGRLYPHFADEQTEAPLAGTGRSARVFPWRGVRGSWGSALGGGSERASRGEPGGGRCSFHPGPGRLSCQAAAITPCLRASGRGSCSLGDSPLEGASWHRSPPAHDPHPFTGFTLCHRNSLAVGSGTSLPRASVCSSLKWVRRAG